MVATFGGVGLLASLPDVGGARDAQFLALLFARSQFWPAFYE